MFLTMRKVNPEFHRFARRLMRFQRGSRSLGAVRANLCTAACAHQVIGDHDQHKHLVYALELVHHRTGESRPRSRSSRRLARSACIYAANRITLSPRDFMEHRRLRSRGVLQRMRRDFIRKAGDDELLRRPCEIDLHTPIGPGVTGGGAGEAPIQSLCCEGRGLQQGAEAFRLLAFKARERSVAVEPQHPGLASYRVVACATMTRPTGRCNCSGWIRHTVLRRKQRGS